MKINFRDIEGFLKSPSPQAKIILVYGPDEGLVRERSTQIAKSVVEDINDPFNVVDVTMDTIGSTPSVLSDEAFAMSMMGGQRLIRLKSADNKVTALLKEIEAEIEKLDNVILLQAGNLAPASSLRKFCETSKNAAALPCYVEDERDLTRFLQSLFNENNLRIDRDALALAARYLHGDRALARNEAEKIITYKGQDTSVISVQDITACLGQGHLETLDMLVQNVASGQTKNVEKSLNILFSEGNPPILILRSLKNYFKRLYITQHRSRELGMEAAMKKLRPPVFFKNKPHFQKHLNLWKPPQLQRAFTVLGEAEKSIKTASLAPELICNRALLSLSKTVKVRA